MAAKANPPQTAVVAYKALNGDFTCRGHKFEVGQTYTVEGEPVLCENGFHACENPFDVLDYYDLVGSRFAKVTLTGAVDRQADGQKVCGTSITVDAELSLPEWIGASVKFLIAACKGKKDEAVQAASGYYSKLEITGGNSAAAAVGPGSRVKATAGTPVAICEYDRDGKDGKPIGFAVGIAGTDFPADIWVIAKDGKLVGEVA